jgi:hypothetical protein
MRTKRQPEYCIKKGNRFFYRRAVPDLLRPELGKTEWVIALGTDSEREARAKAVVLESAHDKLIAEAKAFGPGAVVTRMGRARIEALEAEARAALDRIEGLYRDTVPVLAAPLSPGAYTDRLALLEGARQKIGRDTDTATARLRTMLVTHAERTLDQIPEPARLAIEKAGGVRALFDHVEGDRREIAFRDAALELAKSAGPAPLQVEGGETPTPEEALTHRQEVRNETELLNLKRARLAEGLVTLAPTGLVQDTAPEARGPDALTVNEVFERWIKHRGQKPQSVSKRRAQIGRLISVVGSARPMRDISKAELRDWVDTIAQLPNTVLLMPALRAASVADLLTYAKAHPTHPRVTAITVQQHLDAVKALFRYAARNDFIPANLAADIEAPRDRRPLSVRRGERAFTPEQLRQIDGLARAKWGRDSATYRGIELAIYTGARLEEVARLRTANVVEVDGVPAIQITDSAEWSPKTD